MTDPGNKKDRIRKMKVMTTFGQGRWDQKFEQTVCFTEGDRENQVVNLYPEITYETFEGFGGAITQGAGYVYSQMPESEKKALMEAYSARRGCTTSSSVFPSTAVTFPPVSIRQSPIRRILPLKHLTLKCRSDISCPC